MKTNITILLIILSLGCKKEPIKNDLNTWIVDIAFMRPIINQDVKVSYTANQATKTTEKDFKDTIQAKELKLAIRVLQTNNEDFINIKVIKNDTLINQETGNFHYKNYK